LIVACALLAAGIYGHSPLLAVPAALAVIWLALAAVRAALRRREVRRVGRRDPSGPAGG
jgi:hypothetical protein